MGVGFYRAIVRGRRNACHAFRGMLLPTSYDCDVVWERGTDDDCVLELSGWSKYGLSLSDFGAISKYEPLQGIPEGEQEATEAGVAEMRRLRGRPGVQARSRICGVEVQLTQTDDEDREEDGDALAYVHYVRGERQDDCWTDGYPPELDMPVGGER